MREFVRGERVWQGTIPEMIVRWVRIYTKFNLRIPFKIETSKKREYFFFFNVAEGVARKLLELTQRKEHHSKISECVAFAKHLAQINFKSDFRQVSDYSLCSFAEFYLSSQ